LLKSAVERLLPGGQAPTAQIGGIDMKGDDADRRKQPELALRFREIRENLCGEYGAQFLADALHVRLETWLNYESGLTMPAHVVLKLIDIARVNPRWLLTGQGNPHEDRMRTCRTGRMLQ
jgi:hypothetical protein